MQDTHTPHTLTRWRVRAGSLYLTHDARTRRMGWTQDADEATNWYGTRRELTQALAGLPGTSPALTFERVE